MDSTQVNTDVVGNTISPQHLTLNIITNTNNKYEGIRSRAWFITVLNPTQEEHSAMVNYHKCIYKIWQYELCPDTGAPHFHACLYYKNAVVWPKREFPRAHIEKVINLNDCIKYCSKEESRITGYGPWEDGERPAQGRRTDLEEAAKNYLQNGESTFATENPSTFVRYFRGLRELKAITKSHRDRNTPPTVIWKHGPAGVGKTRSCIEAHESFYIKDGTQWWDGYDQQECIIIDDFDGKWPYRDLLRLLDRYPYQGQVKGGYVKINSPHIYITCEHPPDYYWADNELSQVTRRISAVELITNTNTNNTIH